MYTKRKSYINRKLLEADVLFRCHMQEISIQQNYCKIVYLSTENKLKSFKTPLE